MAKKIFYTHTQIGYLIIITLIISLFFLFFVMIFSQFKLLFLLLIIVLLLSLFFFYSLKIEINNNYLSFQFGGGIIRKKILLSDIKSYRIVSNPWYYGWGIHLTPYGWLYNVSGFEALEIKKKNGRRLRIGTDDSQNLIIALDEFIV